MVTTQPSGSSKAKFAYPTKLLFQRHGDLGAAFRDGGQHLVDSFHFHEERKAGADEFGAERGIVFGNGFLVVEGNLPTAGRDRAEYERWLLGHGGRGLRTRGQSGRTPCWWRRRTRQDWAGVSAL